MAPGDGASRAVVMVVRGRDVVVWVPPIGVRPDLAAIDHLCRLLLDARRRGHELRLRNPCDDMVALVRLAGLAEVFGLSTESSGDGDGDGDGDGRGASVEMVGEAEGGEELGDEEVVQADEPPVADLDDLE